jgi:hypothetical protein
VTDASNSSKPALKSHKAAADAQRAAEARKAAEIKAKQAPDALAVDCVNTNASTGPLDTLLISQSRSSSQALPSQSASPGGRQNYASSDGELELPEENVRLPNGKRKAIGMSTQVHAV